MNGSVIPRRLSYLRLSSWVTAAALLVAGLAAIQPASRAAAAAQARPLVHSVLTPSHAALALLSSAVTLAGADGVVGVFNPITGTSPTRYTSPGVFKASLVKTSSGWNLTEHGCGCVLSFGSTGLLTKTTDRNGNATTVSYNSSHQMTAITSDWGPSAIRYPGVLGIVHRRNHYRRADHCDLQCTRSRIHGRNWRSWHGRLFLRGGSRGRMVRV